nr:uncharacterized protein LOC109166654 isoform X1 [Ipomoea batatas]
MHKEKEAMAANSKKKIAAVECEIEPSHCESYQNVEGRFGNAKGSMQGNPSRQNTRPNTMTNLSSFASLFSGDVSKGDGNVFGGFPQPTITKKSPEIHRGIPTFMNCWGRVVLSAVGNRSKVSQREPGASQSFVSDDNIVSPLLPFLQVLQDDLL